MPEQRPRRFTIADVMILVAAAAVGLGVDRYYRVKMSTGASIAWNRPLSWCMGLAPFLLVCPPALLLARALKPRPRLLRISRQPGTVACLACVFQLTTSAAFFLAGRLWSASRYPFQILFYQILFMGGSVALAWSVLALSGAWRPEPGWIDRAGRGFGVSLVILWILLALCY